MYKGSNQISNTSENIKTSWTICQECDGLGKKKQRLRKKTKLRYEQELADFENTNREGIVPIKPKNHQLSCLYCGGSGLIASDKPPKANREKFPHVAIIGGGIGGVALAVACLHREIPFTLYERDSNFDARSQGYGLTLQQASKAIEGLGILTLKEGVASTRHVVHKTDGEIIVEWGMRKLMQPIDKNSKKRSNVHISRQSLRLELIEQLGGTNAVNWGHQLINVKENTDKTLELSFEVDGDLKTEKADLVVGADGIYSTVRKLLIGDEVTPLQYLGCIVILGICPLKNLEGFDSSLLDLATVFQTVNGFERIYMMPYDSVSIMWQLSFPMEENDAKVLSLKGAVALKDEAIKRCTWHDPIPQILSATSENQISGYPVYDRKLLDQTLLERGGAITLIGDAAHPMSPFKGQGANQALLDALLLAREITKNYKTESNWKIKDIRETVLSKFETEILARSAVKVKDSAEAVKLLHSKIVLREGNEPRGRGLKRQKL